MFAKWMFVIAAALLLGSCMTGMRISSKVATQLHLLRIVNRTEGQVISLFERSKLLTRKDNNYIKGVTILSGGNAMVTINDPVIVTCERDLSAEVLVGNQVRFYNWGRVDICKITELVLETPPTPEWTPPTEEFPELKTTLLWRGRFFLTKSKKSV